MGSSEYNISSVEKVLKLMEVMSAKNGELSVTQIAAKLDSSVSSINRFLQTMGDMGYVKKNPVTKKYYLTNQFISISHSILKNDRFVQGLASLSKLYANKYDIMVNVNSMVGKRGLTMHAVSRYTIKEMDYMPGDTAPAYASGAGRAMLSLYSPEELDEFFRDLDLIKYQRNTFSDEKTLRENLKEVREAGYAPSFEEYTLGLFSLSFPFKTKCGRYYSLTLITPVTEYKKVYNKAVIADVSKVLKEKIAELEE